MSMSEKIRILLIKCGNIPVAELARRIGVTPQNLGNKLKRDNFTEQDLEQIADALGCSLDVSFIIRETGERV